MQKGVSTTSPKFQLAISSASSLPEIANTSVVFSSPEIASLLNMSDSVSASAYSLSSSTSAASLEPVSTLGSSSFSSSSSSASSDNTSLSFSFTSDVFLHSKDLTYQKVHQGTVKYVRASLIFITQSSYHVHLGVTRVLHPLLALNSTKFHLIIHHQVSHLLSRTVYA